MDYLRQMLGQEGEFREVAGSACSRFSGWELKASLGG